MFESPLRLAASSSSRRTGAGLGTLKGGERDDTVLLGTFSDRENEERLFVGWSDYGTGVGTLPVEAQVFNTWFLALRVPFKTLVL